MPAFGGRNFGEIGAYERVIGKAYGENRSAVGFQFYDPGYRPRAEERQGEWLSRPKPTSDGPHQPRNYGAIGRRVCKSLRIARLAAAAARCLSVCPLTIEPSE
jgi:hypothetical protein